MYRIIKPAVIKNTSLRRTIAINQIGNKLQYASDSTSDPTNSLSAIGSKNEPILLACDVQFLAINPSNYKEKGNFFVKIMKTDFADELMS